ncbi:MAG TPA: serine/threonine-protein kinase [Polyangia bacterium]
MHEASRYPRPFGKYLLLRQIAVGGMAEVYLARQSGPAGFEKECVIKRILPSLAVDEQFVQMFLDEARIAARLAHPNIVQIFDLGEAGPHDYFIAMEHVHGVDLQQIGEAESKRGGRVPLAIALRLVSNVAEGLDHAHRATDARGAPLGLVHRDVTPSNVMVSYDGVAKILDFGIAKAVAKKARTEVGVIKGKIPYMSPEQVQGEEVDARSDLFSLGTLLYELTVGHKPFDGQNAADLSLKILHDEPTPPDLLVPHYPDALAAIVRIALAKRRQDRFASARDMQVALEEFLLSGGIRCTAHEVAAYLDDLFPGERERVTEGPVPYPVEVTDPTVPMHLNRDLEPTAGPEQPSHPDRTDRTRRDESGPGPLMGPDLSSPQLGNVDDVRRNLGGGGGGMTFVAIALVIAVAFGFWYLRQRSAAANQPPPALPIAGAPPATAPTPTEAPSAPANAKPAAAPKSPVTHPAHPTVAAPAVAAPSAAAPAPEAAPVKTPAAPKAATSHPAKPHHVHHHAKSEGAVSLPRLPSPPPPDDAP